MKKMLTLAACCVAMGLGSVASANDSISNDTLAAMGLGGATIVTDAQAEQVRGMGYMGSNSFALAGGGSLAYVGAPAAGAGSVNFYLAAGANSASGENFSEAGRSIKHVKSVSIGGIVKKVKTVNTLRVYAGGFSSSMAF